MIKPNKIYIVEKIEHSDLYPSTRGVVFAYSDEEVDFIKGRWDDSTYGRYCRVNELHRDSAYVQEKEGQSC